MIAKSEMDKKEQYLHEVAKIAYDAKHNPNWGLRLDGATVINAESDTKTILGRIGVFTPAEFAALTKGYDFEIKTLPHRNPYSTEKEEDGIYIEKCKPLQSMSNGRHYALISGNKKAGIYLNTKNNKSFSAVIAERHEEGIYVYSISTDEIRLVTNSDIQAKCDNWRKLLNKTREELPDEEIINGITDSQSLWALAQSGTLLANNIHNGQKPNEERFNYLFTTGIKEYMDMYSPRVTESYESELETVSDWTR